MNGGHKDLYVVYIALLVYGAQQGTGSGFGLKTIVEHGKVLNGALITVKTGISLACCVKACSRLETCKSLNYSPSLRWCEINHKMKSDKNANMGTRAGFLYAEHDRLITKVVCEDKNSDEKLVDCGIPVSKPNAVVELRQGTGLYSKATYVCNKGYVAVGKSEIGCSHNGIWEYRKFQCGSGLPELSIPMQPLSAVERGGNITIPCSISATPYVTSMFWLHITKEGTKQVAENCRHSIGTIDTPSLEIHYMLDDDKGKYVCSATNKFGTVYSNAVALTIWNALDGTCNSCPLTYKCLAEGNVNICARYLTASSKQNREYFQKRCACFGANLMRIDSFAKQEIANRILINVAEIYIWIQGNYKNGTWEFDDGSPMLYFNWDVDYGTKSGHVFVTMRSDKNCMWHETVDDWYTGFGAVCEFRL